MANEITPEIAKRILGDEKLIGEMIAAGKDDGKVAGLLKDVGLTSEQVDGVMNPQGPMDDSALERISGGLNLSKTLDYVKKNPSAAAGKVLKVAATVAAIATPIVVGVEGHRISKAIESESRSRELTIDGFGGGI